MFYFLKNYNPHTNVLDRTEIVEMGSFEAGHDEHSFTFEGFNATSIPSEFPPPLENIL
jgi:hypothetical protein